MTWDAMAQKFVVPRARVPYREPARRGSRRSPQALWPQPTVRPGPNTSGRHVRQWLAAPYWASGKEFPDTPCERLDVFDVQFLTTFGRTFPSEPAGLGVGQAFAFSPRERLFFDQHPLSFVALSRTTKPDHHRQEHRVAAGAASQCGVPALEEHKLVEDGTRQAEWPFGFRTKKATFPSSSPHSAQTESRIIQKTTISSRWRISSLLPAPFTALEFTSIG